MSLHLDLYEDVLAPGEQLARPAALHRIAYVREGAVRVGDAEVAADDAAYVEPGAGVEAGQDGATIWRFDLATQAGASAGGRLLHSTPLDLDTFDDDEWLMRCDSVAFPPGGCAYTHTHQGPGTRCLAGGSIRIDTGGTSHAYGPGEAWFEAGPVPVFAQADADVPSRFIRVMVLPRRLLGQSSIAYVNPEDADKPKTQRYRVWVDRAIDF